MGTNGHRHPSQLRGQPESLTPFPIVHVCEPRDRASITESRCRGQATRAGGSSDASGLAGISVFRHLDGRRSGRRRTDVSPPGKGRELCTSARPRTPAALEFVADRPHTSDVESFGEDMVSTEVMKPEVHAEGQITS